MWRRRKAGTKNPAPVQRQEEHREAGLIVLSLPCLHQAIITAATPRSLV